MLDIDWERINILKIFKDVNKYKFDINKSQPKKNKSYLKIFDDTGIDQ